MYVPLLRTLIVYCFILVGVRIMGKRQISQLQTSELVVTLMISELAVIPIEKFDKPIWEVLAPMVLIILCEIVVSHIMLKSGKFRRLICGSPIVVIKDGKILQGQMRRLRMTTEDLAVQLRRNDVFHLKEVEYAIIETNGQMSVVKRGESDYVKPRDLNIEACDEGFEMIVVSDGEISASSLRFCDKDEKWIFDTLKKENTAINDVFIMTLDTKGKYKIIKRNI